MDRRRAKRDACWRSAYLIRDAMAFQLWPQDNYADPDEYKQVCSALDELADELERRGHA